MTESKWLMCQQPRTLVDYLRSTRPLRSERKLRLFACACCRRFWHDLVDERSRRAVEVGERFAEGLATNAGHRQIVPGGQACGTHLITFSWPGG